MEILQIPSSPRASVINPTDSYSRPYEALFCSLPYLQLGEIFAVQRVCRSLRQALEEDVLLWQNVKVEPPLSRKLTDDCLLYLTRKARGRLKSLTLIDCFNVTDVGLQRVIHENPQITKVLVPGCNNLTPEGFIEMVERLPNLEQVAIHGVPNTRKDHLNRLNTLLQSDQMGPPARLHYSGWPFLPLGMGNRPIDIEICPKCDEARLVFDCRREKCEKKRKACRGCYWCIQRCEECGDCVDFDGDDGEDTVCNHALCSNCWLGRPKCLICNGAICSRDAPFLLPATFVCTSCSAAAEEFVEY